MYFFCSLIVRLFFLNITQQFVRIFFSQAWNIAWMILLFKKVYCALVLFVILLIWASFGSIYLPPKKLICTERCFEYAESFTIRINCSVRLKVRTNQWTIRFGQYSWAFSVCICIQKFMFTNFTIFMLFSYVSLIFFYLHCRCIAVFVFQRYANRF